MKLHIITRCTRQNPEWALHVGDSIAASAVAAAWYLVGPNAQGLPGLVLPCDCGDGDYARLLNHYLDIVPDDGQWVYVLDDDNLMHPGFKAAMDQADEAELIVGSQQVDATTVRVANPWDLTVQRVDSAQYCVSRRLIGELRHWNLYRHDGYFLMELLIRAREQGARVHVTQQVMSFYNAQQWLR